jgi:hypothetical protein
VTTKPGKSIEPLQAELLARHVNTAYANTCSYGSDHPLARKACKQAHESLGDVLAREPVITILADRGSLFVEKHPVGSRFDPKRLVKMFAEVGIESVTFEAGIILDDFQLLMQIFAQPDTYPEVEAAEVELQRHHVDSIRFNHIIYRKLTSDQKVVSAESEGQAADGPSRYAGGAAVRVLHELEDFMSLSHMAGSPDEAGQALVDSVAGNDEAGRTKLIEHLRNLAGEIEAAGSVGASSLSPEDLFLAMNTLRQRVKQSLASRRDLDTLLTGQREVISEVDQLTYSTLVSLVLEEYRGSNFSPRRMAQIINRMLPDPRELRRLLPQLKKALIREGMSLKAYSELVHQLSAGLRGEHLVQALEGGAENIGLDVDEIVDRIQDDPTEAARLVVLAAELRRGADNDEDQLSAAFSDYIERMNQKSQNNADGGNDSPMLDPRSLNDQLARVQRELIIQLDEKGLKGTAVDKLNDQLDQRTARAVDETRLSVLNSVLERSDGLSADVVLEWLEQQLLNPSELDRIRGPLTRIMEQHGFDTGQIEEILNRFSENLPSGPPMTLPRRVINCEQTEMFLGREVVCAQRYSTPFSVIRVTIDRVHFPEEEARRPTSRELSLIIPELYTRIVRQARDPDLIGSLDQYLSAEPFLILPMTDAKGADVVCKRLEQLLPDFPFDLDGVQCRITVTTTAITYDIDQAPDVDQFRKQLEYRHQTRRDQNDQTPAKPTAAPRAGAQS